MNSSHPRTRRRVRCDVVWPRWQIVMDLGGAAIGPRRYWEASVTSEQLRCSVRAIALAMPPTTPSTLVEVRGSTCGRGEFSTANPTVALTWARRSLFDLRRGRPQTHARPLLRAHKAQTQPVAEASGAGSQGTTGGTPVLLQVPANYASATLGATNWPRVWCHRARTHAVFSRHPRQRAQVTPAHSLAARLLLLWHACPRANGDR